MSDPPISCVSLGMVVIDDIYMPNREPLRDVLGGSATFVTMGLRLFAKDVKSVGCLVIAGDDFPPTVRITVEEEWGTTTVVRVREGFKSTRGKLVYEDDAFGAKSFTYPHQPLKPTPTDLLSTPLLHARAFHLLASPTEMLALVPDLLSLREKEIQAARPLIVWEPLPSSCTPANYEDFIQACKLVDVFSPNHREMDALFGEGNQESGPFDAVYLERCAAVLLDAGVGPSGEGSVIVRAGEHGAFWKRSTSLPVWASAYHEVGSEKVVDATGAGNAFLGGWIAGWLMDGEKDTRVREAMAYGGVAASFAVEQIGVPGVEKVGEEVYCNGVAILERLEEYRKRNREGR